jgi:hypothetical protein
MSNENERTLIFEFEKNSAEVVRTSISEFKGKQYVDFRVWTSGAAGDLGEKRPTKKGLTISTEILPDLLKAVQAAILHVRYGEEDRSNSGVADFPE